METPQAKPLHLSFCVWCDIDITLVVKSKKNDGKESKVGERNGKRQQRKSETKLKAIKILYVCAI